MVKLIAENFDEWLLSIDSLDCLEPLLDRLQSSDLEEHRRKNNQRTLPDIIDEESD